MGGRSNISHASKREERRATLEEEQFNMAMYGGRVCAGHVYISH